MAEVIRLVWRLDHDFSPDYHDRFGSAYRVLKETTGKHWKTASIGVLPFSLVAEDQNDRLNRRISIEQTNISGWIDWKRGVPLTSIFTSDEFMEVTRVINPIFELAKIQSFLRIGIRFIALVGKTSETFAARWIEDNASTYVLKMIGDTLGIPDDISYIFEGLDTDKLSYRVQFGPNMRKNLDMYFTQTLSEDEREALEAKGLLFDLDLWETKISAAGFSFAKWSRTKIEKAQRFLRAWEDDEQARRRSV